MKVRENKNIDRQGKKHEMLTWYIKNWADSGKHERISNK